MTRYRWLASVGIVLALASAAVHYTVTGPVFGPGPVAYLYHLGPVWPVVFGSGALLLVASLVSGRGRPLAHSVAAGCLATYAVALWASALLDGSTRGVPTAGLATALALHAVLLASAYGGAQWTRR